MKSPSIPLFGKGEGDGDGSLPQKRDELVKLMEEYPVNGGFPEVVIKNQRPRGYLDVLFDAVLFKDVVKRHKVRFSEQIDQLGSYPVTFIPQFNARFSVEPRNKTDLHQKLTQKEIEQLQGIFSRQKERTILNDFTFFFNNQWCQLIKEQPATVCKKDTVIVEERLDKIIHIRLRGKYLNYRLLPKRPERQTMTTKMPWVLPASKAYIPPPDHPWRQSFHANIQAKQNAKVGHFKIPESRTF